MFSDSIHGWASYLPLTKKLVEQLPDGAMWVEIGVFLGKGIIGTAEYAKSLNKEIKFWAVDTWEGSDEPEHKEFLAKIGGPAAFYSKFHENVKAAGVDKLIFSLKGKSVEIADLFEDNSLDVTYIDASHDYDSVQADIRAWLPKVKNGGVLAGHDYNSPVVKQAVHDIFPSEKLGDECDSWIYYVK